MPSAFSGSSSSSREKNGAALSRFRVSALEWANAISTCVRRTT